MKKRWLLLSLVYFFTLQVQAQRPDHCGTLPSLDHQLQRNPLVMQKMEEARAQAAAWRELNPSGKTGGILTIPVVVHVVYKNAQQNISDSQVQSQLAVLNRDYRRLNPDTTNTPAEFDTLAADCEIEFCLATTDPDGNSTSGITRTSSTGGQFFGYFGPTDDVKSSATGGIEPWPTDKYLNIWVCDLLPILAGYAQFPGGDSLTDGVVISYIAFGTEGTAVAPYNGGRTTTHEVGHWLGLFHIWGDNPDCVADDNVSDTPMSGDASSGCMPTNNTCTDSPYDYNDMVQNYMDYSEDVCMNLFTLGQKAVMQSTIATTRAGLSTSSGCLLASRPDDNIKKQIKLFPNPASGTFTLSTPWENGSSVEIVSPEGKTVSRFSMNGASATRDISSLPAGTYLIRVEHDGASLHTRLTVVR